MDRETLKSKLLEISPAAVFDETGQWLNMNVPVQDWREVSGKLRHEAPAFDYLFCLTCIDRKTTLTMVYHFSSTATRDTIVVKIDMDRDKPEIETVSNIWKTAEFHEREVYEMFGVDFLNHPDLRLLILPEHWEGKNPLRKDFEDPVNMLKL